MSIRIVSLTLGISAFLLTACGQSEENPSASASENATTSSEPAIPGLQRPDRWTPEEVNSIAFFRAVHQLAPGDTIHLSAGSFPKFELPWGLSVVGAGPDATTILLDPEHSSGPRWDAREGEATLSGLSIRLDGDPSPKVNYWDAILLMGNWTVRDVRIGPFPGNGAIFEQGTFTVHNLTISDCQDNGLVVQIFHPDSVVDGLTVNGTERGFDLDVRQSAGGTFRNLELTGDGDGAISIRGRTSCPVFEGVDAFILNDILYEDGAQPRDAVTEEDIARLLPSFEPAIYDPNDPWKFDRTAIQARDFDLYQREQRPARTELYRQYSAKLEASEESDTVATALRSFIEELIPTYTRLFSAQSDPWIDRVVLKELDWFARTHDPRATFAVIDGLPQPPYRQEWDDYYLYMFNESTQAAILQLRAEAETAGKEDATTQAFAAFHKALEGGSADSESLAVLFLEGAQSYYDGIRELYDIRNPKFETTSEGLVTAFNEVVATENAELLAAILARFPATETRELPSRRLLLRELPAELRRAVMPLLRGR
jgi:hypothetical protein